MARAEALIEVPEKLSDDVAGRLHLDDPRKSTRNAALVGLLAGTAGATLLAQAAGVVELFNPLATFALYAFMALALPFAWSLRGIDVRFAMRLLRLHDRWHGRPRARRTAKDKPVYLRLTVVEHITPGGTVKMAFEPYSLSLTVGIIGWSALIGITPGGQPITTPDVVLAATIALASMAASLVATWIIPPLWLLRTAGVRVYYPHRGTVAGVDAWYLAILGPFMGVAALGTLFIVYAIGGLTLRPAVFSFLAISMALFPIAFAGTYLYRARREGRASAELAFRLKGRGLRTYDKLDRALEAESRRRRGGPP